MKQDELIKKLFDADFIATLPVSEPNYKTFYDMAKNSNGLKFEEAFNAMLGKVARSYFEAGVDNTLSLLGYQPAFNQSGNNQQTKDNG